MRDTVGNLHARLWRWQDFWQFHWRDLYSCVSICRYMYNVRVPAQTLGHLVDQRVWMTEVGTTDIAPYRCCILYCLRGIQMSNQIPSVHTFTTGLWCHAAQKTTSYHSVCFFNFNVHIRGRPDLPEVFTNRNNLKVFLTPPPPIP